MHKSVYRMAYSACSIDPKRTSASPVNALVPLASSTLNCVMVPYLLKRACTGGKLASVFFGGGGALASVFVLLD